MGRAALPLLVASCKGVGCKVAGFKPARPQAARVLGCRLQGWLQGCRAAAGDAGQAAGLQAQGCRLPVACCKGPRGMRRVEATLRNRCIVVVL